MAKEVQVAVDCADPALLAHFWADALGYQLEAPPAGYPSWQAFSQAVGGEGEDWQAAVDPAGIGPRLLFHRVPEPKMTKNRWHLDVRAGGARGTTVAVRRPLVDAEVDRLVHSGAKHLRTVEDQGDYFAVLQDPEGNEFCVC